MLAVGFSPGQSPKAPTCAFYLFARSHHYHRSACPSGSVGAAAERGKGRLPIPSSPSPPRLGALLRQPAVTVTPEPPPRLGAQLPQPPESASFREAGPWSSANVLQETKFKNVAVAGLHSSEDEPDRQDREWQRVGSWERRARGRGAVPPAFPSERSRGEPWPGGHKFAWECFPSVNN